MAQVCENCGNNYQQPLVIEYKNETHTFDCFECAISTLAPKCGHCGTKIIGHGVENGSQVFCCQHCMNAS